MRISIPLLILLIGLATPAAARPEWGLASWYGPGFEGQRTSNGEVFNSHALTAAQNTLPLGTRVRVTNLKNHKSVVVKVNDHGSFGRKYHRVIDLSKHAAYKLNMVQQGVARVKIEVVALPHHRHHRRPTKRWQLVRR